MPEATRGNRMQCSLLVAALATLVSLVLSGSASAAFTHLPVAFTFSAGSDCGSVTDVAVVESTGTIYAVCAQVSGVQIRKFDLSGNPVDFSATGFSYLNGNAITGDPADPAQGRFDPSRTYIAVDNSFANNGDIFVSGGKGGCNCISVFAPSGKWLTGIPVANQGPSFESRGVAIGSDGSVYSSVNQGYGYGHISKYDTAFNEVRRLLVPVNNDYVSVDSTGAVWVAFDPDISLTKHEADQFTTNLDTSLFSIQGLGLTYATPSPFAPSPLLQSGSGATFNADPTNDDLYVLKSGQITPYSPGDATEPAHQDGPSFGSGIVSAGAYPGLAVTSDEHVYAASNSGGVAVFPPGQIVPDVHTPAPAVDEVGHTSAILHATLERAGGPDITACQIQYGLDTTYSGAGSGTVPCSPNAGSSLSDASIPVTGTIPGLTTGAPYHYRFKATNTNGFNTGLDRTFVPAAVIKLHTLPAEGTDTHGATLKGSFDPDNFASTAYRFDYGLDTGYGQSTPDTVEGTSSGTKEVSSPVSSLPAGRTFHYRIVATNSLGTTYGQDLTFRTASAPAVSGVRATDVTADSATLHARIDPVGYATTYHFEFGTSIKYGSSLPAPAEGGAGNGNSPQEVTAHISNLQPGVTYHFRVLATNQWGTTTSEDTTFDFFPPTCPNAHVRQQTRTGYLPDCRAYELVSPGDAGSVLLFPWEEFPLFLNTVSGVPPIWPVNSGLATSPSRFAYLGGLGAIDGIDAPNGAFDMYMATRTNDGWVTTMPGLNGHDVVFVGDKQCSDSLAVCLDHNEGDLLNGIANGESAPYAFTADGAPLGQLPTNVNAIFDGDHFKGDQRLSRDGRYFAFSSNGTKFAPDGIKESPGSAYDNDIGEETVTVVSKLPSGGPIPQEFNPAQNTDEQIKFPGLSSDGSHILMQVASHDGGAQITDGLVHLYMRVEDAITYDVSRGHGVTFAGMSGDGTKVYFLAKQQLGDGDTDGSTDLYMWSEVGDTLTRVSKGNGEGNSDLCSPSWGVKCAAAALATEHAHPFGRVSATGTDDLTARGSGDIFFFSPENLDPNNPGITNQRNLYVYRGGSVHLVATLDPGTQIDRIQISPDGAHAGFLTDSRLTGYDNKGFREMYTYDANTGAIRCASCRPDGLPPTGNVAASGGGPFMANDGRVFFTTPDSLVPQDSNGGVFDVYEYAAGHPQLISAGTGSRDFTGGGTTLNIIPGVHTGLESVSADGTDVFFSTFDSLVEQDENGPYVKFYDARTNGGFDSQAQIAPCAAADECHGAGSSTPTAPIDGAGATLGGSGNVKKPASPKPHKKTKHHRKQRHRKGHRHG